MPAPIVTRYKYRRFKKAMKYPSMFFAHSEKDSFHFLTLACAATVANRKKTLTLQSNRDNQIDKKTR